MAKAKSKDTKKVVRKGKDAKKPFEFDDVTGDLTDRQMLFCMKYLELGFNGTKAAVSAGYSELTANEQSSRLLANVNITTYIKKLQSNLAESIGVSAQMIANEYKKIGFANIVETLTENNSLNNLTGLDENLTAAVKKVKIKEIKDKDGVKEGELIEVELHDKIAGLQNLSKMIGVDGVTKTAVTDTEGKDLPPTKTVIEILNTNVDVKEVEY